MVRRVYIAAVLTLACCLQFTLLVGSAHAGATASFVGTDTTTRGNWQPLYGSDGYYLANSIQSSPSYAALTPQNQVNYTWSLTTTDPRALALPNGGGRIAAAWYSTGPFSLNVNITDGQTHPFSVYAVDWDSQGRSETIQILDANNPSTVLSQKSISGFTNGIYVTWNISGNVIVNVMGTSGPNGVVSGAFFGKSTSGASEAVSVSPQTIALNAGGQQLFQATITNATNPSQTVTWSIGSVTPSNQPTGSFSGSTAGLYTAPSTVTVAETVMIVATDQDGVAGNATITLNPNVSVGSANVTFVALDTATQGNWQGKYGIDGYALANSVEQLPTYDPAFVVENQENITWATGTTDPRALTLPAGGRIASAWYSNHVSIPPTFTFDVNLTDNQTHLFALYALDWDAQGRAETIQVYDANSGALLDTRNISNFVGGTYIVWTISGHVTINVTETVGTNCVISGAFFGGSASSAINVSVAPPTVGLPPGQSQQFTATVTGTSNTGVSWTTTPSNVGSIGATTGNYTAPAQITSPQTLTVTAASAADSSKTGNAMVTVTTGGIANFLVTDTVTQGSWQGVYGADGHSVAGDPQTAPPAYGTQDVLNDFLYTWNSNTPDSRALQASSGGRIAATWYNSPTFSVDVNVTDGKLHQFALYALDWDGQGRAETIQVLDATTGNVVDTRSISNFSQGMYLVWKIAGHITIHVTATAGPNAVISGIFFGGGTSANVSVAPPTAGLAAGETQLFTASGSGTIQGVTWSVTSVSPSGASAGGFSASTPGLYTAPVTITTATTVTIAATSLSNGATGTATITLLPNATATRATFDSSTQGAWHGHYGSQGYSIAGDSQSLPSYATFSVQIPNGTWIWAGSTSDPRALQTGNDSGGIAACWYKNHESFYFDVNFTDGQAHQFALYALDWDSQGRSETIQILDARTGAVLDTEAISNFTNGIYVIWTLSGHVTINVTVNSGANSAISGAFFK